VYNGLRVAVVVPAYNEERLIARTLTGLPPFVDRVLLVDDASTDRTAAVAEACGLANVCVARRASNGGVGRAILDGYALAAEDGADVAVVVGADAQMDPGEMTRLLDPIADGRADYVKGDRLGHPELAQRMPPVRILGNFALTWLTRLALGTPRLRDSQCGYSALRTSVARRLAADDLWMRYGFPNDLLARLLALDARTVDVPVTPIYGEETSGIRLPQAVPTLLYVLARAWWRKKKQRKMGQVGGPGGHVAPRFNEHEKAGGIGGQVPPDS
jgi:glycosyltransferase involved in cell wall biosynthesis